MLIVQQLKVKYCGENYSNMLIKGFQEKINYKGFNPDTIEWKNKKLKEMTKRELIDLVVNQFAVNIAMKEELKQTQRIMNPRPVWTPS